MARQTKVDSAGRRAAERREGSASSHASDSGTYAAPGDAHDATAGRAHRDAEEAEAGSPSDDQAFQSERVAASHEPEEDDRNDADADLAAARVSSIEQLGTRAASGDDDESVSLDELLISDSSEDDEEEEEEEEATDIHPGLSESLLAESLRPAPVPRVLEEPAEAVSEREDAADLAPTSEPEPASDVTISASGELGSEEPSDGSEDASRPDASSESDPEEVVVGASAEELAANDELVQEGAADLEPAVDLEAAVDLEPAVDLEDVAPESEAAMEVELAPESEAPEAAFSAVEASEADGTEAGALDGALALEPEAAAEGEPVAAADVDADETTAEPPPAAPRAQPSERQTLPEPLAAKRGDAPLPSFDIPDAEAASARRGPAAVDPRARPVELPALSEDDDDAVTHMGLPVVPEAANDFPAAGYPAAAAASYPAAAAASGFAVADPHVAALQSLDADIARGDSRRATTRVIPRLDPKSIPARPRAAAPAGPALGERLLGFARDAWQQLSNLVPAAPADPTWGGAEVSLGRRRLNWLVENVLPPLSLVLFGSGLGAGVIMLVDNDSPVQAQTVQSLQDSSSAAPRGPLTLADRARTGDGEALYKITNMPQSERTSVLTLALEAGYQAQKQKEFREFVKATSNVSAPLPPAAVTRMVEYATSSETMLPAFQELAQWPGSAGPDLLYSVWERAAGGSRAASLAQQLLYSTDQRAKATPSLLVALDLRSATTCDDYLRLLPAVVRDGDQRSSATLRSLRHSDGCGGDGKQDCYPCLRDTPLLDDALKTVERR